MTYPIDPNGLAFWLAWGIVGGAVELAMVLTGNVPKTMSYQVWSLAQRSPGWVRAWLIGGMGFGATALAVHFFGRFG